MSKKIQLSATTEEIARRFSAELPAACAPAGPNVEVNAFDHALHPIVRNENPGILTLDHQWGLIPPDWKKEPSDIWNHTATAKLEHLEKKYAWRKVILNRCLVPVTAYYEYHWNDPKGKSKTKYIIRNAEQEIFALAGLYSSWKSPAGKMYHTFAICTTQGNETMKFVHNKDIAKEYYRMPVMLNRADETNWLDISLPALTAIPYHNEPGPQLDLF